MKKLHTICLTIISVMICNAIHSQVFDIVVAKDGTGDYLTLNEAINAIRDAQVSRTLIFIKKGVYEGEIVIKKIAKY
jgi:pectinesterase